MPATETDRLQLTLGLSCEHVPPSEYQGRSMEFGAQDKAGVLHAGTAEADGVLAFALPVTARLRPTGAEVDFGGAFVHGRPGERFLYLGYRPVGETSWTRRWKIPLAGITAEQVREAANGSALLGRISATSGSTARLLGSGWSVGSAEADEHPNVATEHER